MATLYLLKYNNYYNRIVKKEDTVNGYLTTNSNYISIRNVNFIPNNWVNTEQTVNISADIDIDYVLVVDENTNKFTRWFIIDSTYNNWTQCTLSLHRDLVADYYDAVVNADTFIEKGFVDQSNNLIFNKEDMSFNQIKQKEILLKDNSKTAWLVLYAARLNSGGGLTTYSTTYAPSEVISRTFDSVSDFEEWGPYQVATSNSSYPSGGVLGGICDWTQMNLKVYDEDGQSAGNKIQEYKMFHYGNSYLSTDPGWGNVSNSNMLHRWVTTKNPMPTADAFNTFLLNNTESINEALKSSGVVNNLLPYNNTVYEDIKLYANTVIAVKQNNGDYKYYRLTYKETLNRRNLMEPLFYNSSQGIIWSNISSPIQEFITGFGGTRVGNNNTKPLEVTWTANYIEPTLEEITSDIEAAPINIDARVHLSDAPYDMFCIPYMDGIKITNSLDIGFTEIYSNQKFAIEVATALTTKYSGIQGIMDAQILPYCPLDYQITAGNFDINTTEPTTYTKVQTNQGNVVGYIFHAKKSSFQTEIKLDSPIVINDYKIESQTDMARFVSPNYNGAFEIIPAENGGISTIRVSCTYKPYDPYIKLYPSWGRIYTANNGTSFADARGLVCGGDFSLPIVTSAWETYQLQNKTYQQSFDREIQNMSVIEQKRRTSEGWQIAAGTISAATTGAMTGMMVSGGNPLGAAIGGGVAGAASLATGLVDQKINRELYDENLNFKKDMFGYSLQNIQALPQSLSKVSAFNVDNKYFPFIELYSCSEVEKDALKKKIKFNGMTVMVMGKINQYINASERTYVKGIFVRAEDDANFDYHISKALGDEVAKGMFIGG